MIFRANVVVPSVIGTFCVVTALTGNPINGLIGIFSASFVAAQELFNIFLVITFMTALLNSLKRLVSLEYLSKESKYVSDLADYYLIKAFKTEMKEVLTQNYGWAHGELIRKSQRGQPSLRHS